MTTVSGCKLALIRSHLCTSMSRRRVAFVAPSLSCWHRSFSVVQYGVSFEFCVDQVGFVDCVSSARFRICMSPFVVLASLIFAICRLASLVLVLVQFQEDKNKKRSTIFDLFNSHLYFSKSLHRVAFEDPPPSDLSTAAGRRCWSLRTTGQAALFA